MASLTSQTIQRIGMAVVFDAIKDSKVELVKKLMKIPDFNPCMKVKRPVRDLPLIHIAIFAVGRNGKKGLEVFKLLLKCNNICRSFGMQIKADFLDFSNSQARSRAALKGGDLYKQYHTPYSYALLLQRYDNASNSTYLDECIRLLSNLMLPKGEEDDLNVLPKTTLPSAVLNRFEKLFNEREDDSLSDVTLKVGDEETRAHKNILVNASTVFKAALCGSSNSSMQSSDNNNSKNGGSSSGNRKKKRQRKNSSTTTDGMIEAQTNVITVGGNATMPALKVFLLYLYCGKLDPRLLHTHATVLLELAEMYDVEDMKITCENLLCKKTTVENVIESLIVASMFNAEMLKRKCIKTIENNASILMFQENFTQLATTNPVLWKELQLSIQNNGNGSRP